MPITTLLGFLSLKKKSGKLIVVGLAASTVLAIWGKAQWDDWKISRLERDNQRLEVEAQTSKQTLEEVVVHGAITDQTVQELMQKKDDAAEADEMVKEQVRNDVRRLQEELAALEGQRRIKERELSEQPRREREWGSGTDSHAAPEATEQGTGAPIPQVVVREVRVPGPTQSIDDRVAQRILDGMWDNYCGQVADRRCGSQ